MASQVDVTFPADDEKVAKADFRAQMLIINQEISALQARIAYPGSQAYRTLTIDDVNRAVRIKLASSLANYARGQAFSRNAKM